MHSRPTAIPPTPLSASINRIRIVDLPGVPIDTTVRGALAYHLLSGPALIRYAQTAGEYLKLPALLRTADTELPQTRQTLPRAVDKALHDADPAVRHAAAAIARRLGRNLAYILLTLHHGDEVNRAARRDWGPGEWEHWARIGRIWMGGGVISGDLGIEIVAHANTTLRGANCATDLTVARALRPQNMALLGAARYLPPQNVPEWHALCIDFGQTSAKCAMATIVQGTLRRLLWFPSVPVSWHWRNDPTAGHNIDGRDVLDFAARAIASGVAQAQARGAQVVEDIAISIAAYTDGGKLLGNGIYARMSRLAPDVRPLLADRVMALGGGLRRYHVVHDGTAAAALHAGIPHSAVIVVGTALGVGFPPKSEAGLMTIAPDLWVGRDLMTT
jgi:hypothetical protein